MCIVKKISIIRDIEKQRFTREEEFG